MERSWPGSGRDRSTRHCHPTRRWDRPRISRPREATLGDGLTPSFYLDFTPIGGLLSLPGASTDPQIEQAKPYLDRLDYLIAGSGVSGGRLLSRVVLGVKDASGSTGDVTAALTAP